MYIHDISRDVFATEVYDGDTKPSYEWNSLISKGAQFNLSTVTMSSHAATHIDAPSHYIDGGTDIDKKKLSSYYGNCTVISIQGILTGEDMERLLPHCKSRLLLRGEGKAFLSSSAAVVIADSHVVLVGTDASSISIGGPDGTRTHRELLKTDVAILEGLDLSEIKDGTYLLCAFPLKLGGLEAAPCRAVLLEQEKGF